MEKCLLILIVIIVVLCSAYFLYPQSEEKEQLTNGALNNTTPQENKGTVPCICAFDLDGTVTCGNPTPALELCKEKGCKIAVNTARPLPVLTDIMAKRVKFPKSIYQGQDVYHNPRSYSSTSKEVGEYKADILDKLTKKYNVVNKRCVLLIDDMLDNVKACINRGYSAIKCSDRKCGIDEINMAELKTILESC